MGQDVPGAVSCLRYWNKRGIDIILSTMRYDEYLDEAVQWFAEHEIKLFGIQKHPTQHEWTSSPKCDGDICVDDRNAGTPLVLYPGFKRPCVLWDDLIDDKGVVTLRGIRWIVDQRLAGKHFVRI
jgi:hypothetical protein